MKVYWRYESIPELEGLSGAEALARYLAARPVAVRLHGRVRWFAERALACTAAGVGVMIATSVGVWGGAGAFFGGAIGAMIIHQREISLVRPVLQAGQHDPRV
jgi:hypothetical protein